MIPKRRESEASWFKGVHDDPQRDDEMFWTNASHESMLMLNVQEVIASASFLLDKRF